MAEKFETKQMVANSEPTTHAELGLPIWRVILKVRMVALVRRDCRLCLIDSRMLNDNEIVISVQEESDPVDDEMDEDEDNNNNESSGSIKC
ncbi:hypothetical protein TNCV_2203301 [Trichonephila clavipes]|nr:hypothetical protein TNCV_2203301 [Trichonephila clavipes]